MGIQALANRVIFPPSAAPRPRLLLIGEHPPALAAECRGLRCELEAVATGAEALAAEPGGVAVIALSLRDGSGVAVMRTLLARDPSMLVLLRAEHASPAARSRLRGAGAWAVIGGDWGGAAQVVEAAVELCAARQQVAAVRRAATQANRLQLIGQLGAEVAHEINNTVAFLSANLHHLVECSRQREGLVDQCEPRAAAGSPAAGLDAGDELRCLEETLDGVRQLQHIAGDLRALVRGGGGREAPRCFSLEAVVRKAMEYAAVKAGSDRTLTLRVAGDARLEGWPERMVQVVVNLLFNALSAVEACPDGEVAVSVRALGESVEVAVEDSGGGVPPELEEVIFEPFFTTRERDGGTGLGLSICRDIVAEHGGQLRLEPLPGGARFVVSLPAVRSGPLVFPA